MQTIDFDLSSCRCRALSDKYVSKQAAARKTNISSTSAANLTVGCCNCHTQRTLNNFSKKLQNACDLKYLNKKSEGPPSHHLIQQAGFCQVALKKTAEMSTQEYFPHAILQRLT